jgi:hypothetical protein
MAVSLTKGGNVSLTKEAPGLTAVTIALGWDTRTTTGADFDLDASAIAVDAGAITGFSQRSASVTGMHQPSPRDSVPVIVDSVASTARVASAFDRPADAATASISSALFIRPSP